MAYNQNQHTENINNTAFNTDAMLTRMLGSGAMLPAGDWDFVEYLPPALPLIINYRLGGGAGAIVRQVTITYVGTDVSTMTRTI